MSNAFVLVLALLLDGVMGEPVWLWSRLPHPAVAMGRVVNWLDRRLNAGPDQKRNGAIASAVLIVGAGVLG
ncbi:MAG: cobalamin biosynthesis protein, partial [Rhodobacteraceae bacterium]|nr:cobalamin biosynthesis protein [Paracoccaceae bacterium]